MTNDKKRKNTGGSILWGDSLLFADNASDPEYLSELAKEVTTLSKLIEQAPEKKFNLLDKQEIL